uniref:Protein kinase domain-containing protein n=1 Tax=Gouania willdenowi TaxID=441366 RepID=A0A8C5E0Q8_GOUWI
VVRHVRSLSNPREVLQGSTNAYTILKHIGEGGFGKVFKCQVNDSEEVVAVKILKNMNIQDIKDELDMLDVIGQLNADQVHVVKLYEKFQHCGFTCLVFEMLDIDLFQYCQNKGSLDVNAIRPIAMQLLETLQALKSLGITHGDFKYDNIMLVNREDLPYRVKLIDFGLAFYTNKAKFGRVRQIIGFRSPEVSLGLPYTEAIDMWALGCLLAFLYLGYSLFPESCEHLLFRSMVEILGIPSELINRKKARTWPRDRIHFQSLDDLFYYHDPADTAENVDRKVFIDLLKKMLHLNGAERISPTEALQHPFITMSHLSHDQGSREYLNLAQTYMNFYSFKFSETETLPPLGDVVAVSAADDNKEANATEGYDYDQLVEDAFIKPSKSTLWVRIKKSVRKLFSLLRTKCPCCSPSSGNS